ncbi:MAG: histidine kinase, partial [Cyanobacteriota bacterium]|nr:histidine kinase [Cyanobacteriota bacterium]
MPKFELVHWLSHLRIRHKIGLGYALALGIAVSGTAIGFVLGDRYYLQAVEKEERARNQVEMLHRLQTSI